jgi:MFS family permease
VRALRVIAIAFLTALAGGILSVVASLYLTELYHVSNFEGGRGMLMFFARAPLGLVVGFIIGLIIALRSRGTGFGGFAKAQGVALGIAIGLTELFPVFFFSPPIIHPNSMANRSRSNSSLKFRGR